MARIGLIEIRAANHELSGLCKISNTKKNRVTIFTMRKLFPHVEAELHGETCDYEWVFAKNDESVCTYLKRVERICNKRIDIVIINTYRNWQFMFFRPRSKMLAIVYNLNFWFRDIRSPLIWAKRMMDRRNITHRGLLTNAITAPTVANILLSRLTGVIVEYPPFKPYIHENFRYGGKIYFFPNGPFEGTIPQPKSNRIRFTIPGRIQEARRDYWTVLQVFERLFPKYADLIELHLVGKPVGIYAQKIVSRCRDLQKKGYRVFYPTGYVSASFLEDTLRKTDVIISPTQVRYRFRTIEEIYTVTKGTGIFSDIVKYAKPAIVPHTYNVIDEIRKSFLGYRSERDLQCLLQDLIEDGKKLDMLKKEALKTSEQFSLGKLHESFNRMVQELLSIG